MKKTLIATSALATLMLADAAAAQVSFGGYGRFGLGYVEDRADEEVALVSRFRLNIDGKAVTDGGVEFSARIRMQADDTPSDNEQNTATLNGARYTVQYGGFRVDAGNIAGSFDNLANYYGYEPGLEYFTGQYAAVDYGFVGYSSTGAGANGVYVSYTAGGFTFGASYDPSNGATGDAWDIGASYAWNNFTGAVAYGENDADQSLVVVTLAADFDAFSGVLFVGDEDLGAGSTVDGTFYGASLSYDVGAATTIYASFAGGEGDDDVEAYAVGVIYDLGGGVSLKGGLGSVDDNMVGDLGVNFNF